MTGDSTADQGRALYEQGWRQGAVFKSTELTWLSNARDAHGQFVPLLRAVKAKETLVLITQDCDIIAKDKDEEYVEALICKEETRRSAPGQIGTARATS